MRTLLLIAALLPAAAIEARTTPKPLPATCARPSAQAVNGGTAIGPHKLGDLPPAKQYLAVLREIDGCPQPVVLRPVQPAR